MTDLCIGIAEIQGETGIFLKQLNQVQAGLTACIGLGARHLSGTAVVDAGVFTFSPLAQYGL